MSKAVLVTDMPENCLECPLLNGNDECIGQDEDANFKADTFEELRGGCPLRELSKKKEVIKYMNEKEKGYCEGWNACIDILETSSC